MFNAYISGFFDNIDDLGFASFTDANTLYSCVIEQLRGIDKIFYWFAKNFLKGNADNCNLPIQKLLWKSRYPASQGQVKRKLSFDYHISQFCKYMNAS